MRTFLLTTIVGTLLFCSCVTNKTYRVEEQKMLVNNKAVMLIKANGDTVKGKSLSVPSTMHPYAKWIKFDGNKIQSDGIVALQDGKSFYGKFGNDSSYHWVKQIKRGKINLYYFDVQTVDNYSAATGHSKYSISTYFVVQKGNEPLQEANIAGMAERLKDNKAAYARFVQQFGEKDRSVLPKNMSNHPKVLFDAIDIYNSETIAFNGAK
jgi:hypothetical protein